MNSQTPSLGGTSGMSTRDRKISARIIGSLFLAGFAFYGTGHGLVASVTKVPDFLVSLSAHQTTLILGAFLMLLNTAVDLGKGVLFFPILERHGKRTALMYLSALIVQVAFLNVGVLCLLGLVPLGQHLAEAGATGADWTIQAASQLIHSNTMAYHIGQATLSFGGIFLCLLLYRARLLPRLLAGWGLIGYVIHLAGAIAEIFGVPISMMLLIPGGLFELALALWLIFRGFEPEPQARNL